MRADEAIAVLRKRSRGLTTQKAVSALEGIIRDLADNLTSTTWSSGCWCSGKDRRGHSATCESRRAAIRMTGRTPPGRPADVQESAPAETP